MILLQMTTKPIITKMKMSLHLEKVFNLFCIQSIQSVDAVQNSHLLSAQIQMLNIKHDIAATDDKQNNHDEDVSAMMHLKKV